MSVVCPEGHTSTSTDYCDVCGAPIPASAVVMGGDLTTAFGASRGGLSSGRCACTTARYLVV